MNGAAQAFFLNISSDELSSTNERIERSVIAAKDNQSITYLQVPQLYASSIKSIDDIIPLL